MGDEKAKQKQRVWPAFKLLFDFDLLKTMAFAFFLLGIWAYRDVKSENEQHINLKVAGQDGSIVQFKIKRHTQLKKLMQTYCDRQGLQLQTIRFRFDGQAICENDTPVQLEMENDDTIDVFTAQTGGWERLS